MKTQSIIMFCLLCGTVHGIRKYYMDQRCGSTLEMSSSITSGRMKLTRSSSYKNRMDCTTHIKAPKGKMIMIVFRDVDIQGAVFGTCRDKLRFYDGDSTVANPVGGLSYDICGEKRPSGAFYTNSRYLTIRFTSNDLFTDDGFDIIFTSYHLGSCSSDEFKCDKGQCIDKSLKCDSYNHCGDHSDECLTKVGAIVGGVIAVVVVIGVIVAIVICCRRKRRGGIVKYNAPPAQATVVTTADPVPQQAGYPTQTVGYQQPAGYPQPGYPPQQPGYPPQQPGYPPQQPGYPPQPAPYPQGTVPPPQPGVAGPPPSYSDVQSPYPYGAPGQ